MIEEKKIDYENYIQNKLKEIDDLDERRFAKELLLEGLGNVFTWTEKKYEALEKRIQDELDVPWKSFHVFMTIIDRTDYDPINHFWFPVCGEDIKENRKQEYETIYLAADEEVYREFNKQKVLVGTDSKTGKTVRFKIEKSVRYWQSIKKLYELFAENYVPWQTLHIGYLERFYDLIPEDGTLTDKDGRDDKPVFRYGEWDKYIRTGKMLLWNIEKTAIHSSEFRLPCIDETFYEHIFYLSQEQTSSDGYLVEAGEKIRSVRYEKNKIVLKTEKASLENVFLHRLYQGKPEESVGYQYPVLSNSRKDNLAARYLQQTGNFIQSPMELYRKIEEMSGGYRINVLAYEITVHAEGELLNGDMNAFTGTGIFEQDKRSILLFKIQKEEQYADDYLYESQIRYILSQMQMELMEYKCMGVLV